MKRNNGIVLIKLLAIIILIFILISFIIYNLGSDIRQTIEIGYKTMTSQINIEEEINKNEILMGITDVKGKGIVIDILDGTDLIHQEDLIILLDELKNAGSQAISVNNVRITNLTYLYCDGSVILIDGEKIGNPFQIKAIGDSQTIYGALNRNKGYISTLKNAGIEINMEEKDNIEIPKTKKSELVNYGNNKTQIGKLRVSNQMIGKENMQGSGIEIQILETKAKLTALSFLQIVNDLQSAGVQAISINGNRITSMTDMMDISNTYVLINSIPIKGPYVIEAIGDKDKIEEVLSYKNSYISKIIEKGNEVYIYRINKINIDKYEQKRDKNKMSMEYII